MQTLADTGAIDVGSLTWVQGEIDQALSRGFAALGQFAADPSEVTALKHAQAHIHQAVGAIQMVGLDAVVAFTDEMERLLARLEEMDAAEVAAGCVAVERAGRRLSIFLSELVNGAPLVALRLLPEYEAMQHARGLQVATPADLFFPELSPRVSLLSIVPLEQDRTLASHLITQRRVFQRGLLSWLRGGTAGAVTMREAVSAVEGIGLAANVRLFWWTVGALLDALASSGLESSLNVKQVVARIDMQMRRLADGSVKVADRLRREVLYYCAISASTTESIREVQRVFNLAALIPSATEPSPDILRLQPLLRQAREEIANAKDAWAKLASGRGEHLPRLRQTMSLVQQNAKEIGNAPLVKLTTSLAERLDNVPALKVGDPMALEYATALLFADNAFDNYANLGGEFPQQVEAMLSRLDAGERGEANPDAALPLLDEMSKRAQGRLLVANVCREVQSNLRHMEQVLDAFFREPKKHRELGALANDSRQVRGALSMLGFDRAEELLRLCQEQIDGYAMGNAPVANDDLELLAESLSCLGFYIEAIEQQRPDPERLIAPILARRLSRQAEAATEAVSAPTEVATDAVSAPIEVATESPKKSVVEDMPEVIELDDALDEPAIAAPPTPAISEETQRLLATDKKGLDAEFLDIYLNEANEVLDSIARSGGVLERDPTARDALRTVRRGFHTLKGSGRMVGLTDLGEIAYAVEKIQNRLLEDERPVSPAALTLIVLAERSFREWVSELRRHGRVRPDSRDIDAAILALEGQWAVEPLPKSAERAPEIEKVATAPAPVLPPLVPMLPPLFEVEDLAELGSADASVPEVASVEELTELGSADASIPELASVEESRPEDLPAVEEMLLESAAAMDASPVEELVRPAPIEAQATGEIAAGASSTPAKPDEIIVGNVTVSGALFRILVPEAGQHLATLSHELTTLQRNPVLVPSPKMVRASHTLCGIHRTGGLTLVAETAKSLEQCLLALQQRGSPLHPAAMPVVTRAIAVLTQLAARVGDREAFTEYDRGLALQSQYALEALRQETSTDLDTTDAETLALREAASEEIESEPPTPVDQPIHDEAAEHAIAPRDLAMRDDVDQQVLPIFLEEASELFPQAVDELHAWQRRPDDAEAQQRLRRTLHTFKGSARMSGAMRLGELTHRMESRLLDGQALVQPAPALFEALAADLDQIGFLLDALRLGRTDVPIRVPTVPVETVNIVPLVPRQPAPTVPVSMPSGVATEFDAAQRALLRVGADVVDQLVNEAGEMAITRARVESELRALKANLLELTSSVIRLRKQVREIEIQGETQIQSRMSTASETAEGFDPLEFDRYTRFQELTRSLTEGVNDVATVQQALLKNIDDAEVALLAQARLSRDMQQQLFAIRTVPFASVAERLYRILRQTAKELDKRANLEIQGGKVELDRSVLEKLIGPLEHLLRNALDHGIESADLRRRAGKSEIGEITLTVRQLGNEITIELADDGAGLDLAQIRAKAIAQNRFAPDAEPSEAQLIECIFTPGLSTASEVTELSGRGIGLDVVRSGVAALGGRVEVSTQAGGGTAFRIYVPLTLAVAQAVLLRAGGRLWAVPSPMVEQVQQVKADMLRELYDARAVEWQDRRYPLHYLPRLLGDTQHHPESARYNPLLLLRSGQNFAAVHADEVLGTQEVVIKNIGPQLARVSGIAGATVLGTGEIVLIINPVQLAQRADVPVFDPNAPDQIVAAMAESPRLPPSLAPVVMIVDDSLTVRKVTSRLLTREGFSVVTARDGAEALELLGQHNPDVILLDIEMPRLDGFEFTRTIKAMPRTAHIPIIMITSRTAEKHRTMARELGVDLYLGKPFQEEELLRHLREMLALIP